jgi:transposase InsO family protein
MKNEVLKKAHENLLAGHLGTKKTKHRILQGYYWFQLKDDVKLFVRGCDICAANADPKKKPKAPMGHLPSGAPWDVIAIDYMGPLPITENGNRYVMVLTDHFTKYAEVFSVPSQQADVCVLKIANEFIARWGCPLSIHSDLGATFESRIFKELCRLFEVRKTRTTPRNPKANGQCERFNRSLIKMVKAYLVEQDEWDKYLGCLAGAYRSAPNESTKLTPNLMCLVREVRMPVDLVHGYALHNEPKSEVEHVQDIRDHMLRAHEVARRYLKVSAQRSKDRYDIKASFTNYKVGDVVWLLHEARKVTPKLEKKFDGPCIVVQKLSPITFKIQINQMGEQRLAHHDKLNMYEGTNRPKWMKALLKKLK